MLANPCCFPNTCLAVSIAKLLLYGYEDLSFSGNSSIQIKGHVSPLDNPSMITFHHTLAIGVTFRLNRETGCPVNLTHSLVWSGVLGVECGETLLANRVVVV